jgi:hypothetical protein
MLNGERGLPVKKMIRAPYSPFKKRVQVEILFKQIGSVDYELDLLIQMADAWDDIELFSAARRIQKSLKRNVPLIYRGAFNSNLRPLPTER